MMKKIFCLALLAVAALPAAAQEPSAGYVGANWGVSSNYALSCYPGLACDRNTSRSGKIYAGYTLGTSKVFGTMQNTSAIELSAFAAGGAYGYLPRWDTALMQARYRMAGLAVTHASTLMLTDALGLNSRLGLAYTRGSAEFPDLWTQKDYGSRYSYHHYRLGATAGVGLSYALGRNWSAHADYDYVPVKYADETGNSHVNMWSVGVSYHF
jgi:opacity protein-like surface antigen